MGPIVKEMNGKYADKSVEFVTFYFTTDETKAASEKRADDLGLAKVYSDHEPKSVYVLLYDPAKKAVVTKLTAVQESLPRVPLMQLMAANR